MAHYRKVDTRIWNDEKFRSLSTAGKLDVIKAITSGIDCVFSEYAGPTYRVADKQKRRPDLYSAAWRKVRLEVISEKGSVCHYCQCNCENDPTIDHIVPVCQSGEHYEKENLVVACRSCNSKKGGKEGWQ